MGGVGVEVKTECFFTFWSSVGGVISLIFFSLEFFLPSEGSGIGFLFLAGILPGLDVWDGFGERSLVLLVVVD